jgi:hypothetical protein
MKSTSVCAARNRDAGDSMSAAPLTDTATNRRPVRLSAVRIVAGNGLASASCAFEEPWADTVWVMVDHASGAVRRR